MIGPKTDGGFTFTFNGQEVKFEHLGMGLLALSQDPDILVQMIKCPGFIFSSKDYESFVNACIALKWQKGLALFLKTFSMQMIFANINFEGQKRIVRKILTQPHIVTEVLTKPYLKGVFSEILEFPDQILKSEYFARESLKLLTPDDFTFLMYQDEAKIQKALNRFECVNKGTQEAIIKVLNRIRKEIMNEE
jgi:hypothetical protein